MGTPVMAARLARAMCTPKAPKLLIGPLSLPLYLST